MPGVDQIATPLCARCQQPLGFEYHVNWHGGPAICKDCWYTEVEAHDYAQYLLDLEEHRAFIRECEG